MHARRAALAVLLVAATATACSSSGDTDDKTPIRAAKPNSKPSASASAPADAGPLKIGAPHRWTATDTDGTRLNGVTTVMAYNEPVKMDKALSQGLSDFPDPEWATVDVKLCATATSGTVQTTQSPWALGFPDDTRVKAPMVSGAGVPKPEYPVDATALKAGSCLRGLITFSFARGTHPDRIIYTPADTDPVEWAVPKA